MHLKRNNTRMSYTLTYHHQNNISRTTLLITLQYLLNCDTLAYKMCTAVKPTSSQLRDISLPQQTIHRHEHLAATDAMNCPRKVLRGTPVTPHVQLWQIYHTNTLQSMRCKLKRFGDSTFKHYHKSEKYTQLHRNTNEDIARQYTQLCQIIIHNSAEYLHNETDVKMLIKHFSSKK